MDDRSLIEDGIDGRQTVVVKIGGARTVDPAGALADVAGLVASDVDVIVVHGGSTALDETLTDLGREPTYVETPSGVVGRFTDAETMEVLTMVMAGKLNTDLVSRLQNAGVDAVGLSGLDGCLLAGKRKSAVRVLEDGTKKIKRGERSATIDSVNADLLATLLADGYTPVVGLPVCGREPDGGVSAVNTDADRAAAAVAGAVGGDLVLLTDVAGVYADPADPSTRIDRAATPAAFETVRTAAEGFMTKKVMAAAEALEGGASSVVVADANADEPVTSALAGNGTTLTPGAIGTDESTIETGQSTPDAEVTDS